MNFNVIYPDNMSNLRLETSGMESTNKQTRHFDLKLFYITDLVKRKEIEVKYCPSDKMIADYLSKKLTRKNMKVMRRWILNLNDMHLPVVQQECVEKLNFNENICKQNIWCMSI